MTSPLAESYGLPRLLTDPEPGRDAHGGEEPWLPVETRPSGGARKIDVSLYARLGNTPLMRIPAALLAAIGDPDFVRVFVQPKKRRLRLEVDMRQAGRRVIRPAGHGRTSMISATGIPEALGLAIPSITRFDAAVRDWKLVLTLRQQP